MRRPLSLILLLSPVPAAAQAIPAGKWDIMSTAVDIVIPGAPSFLVRMMTGRSKTERKCIAPAQTKAGVAALLTPDPKAQCRVDSLLAGDGRYSQALTCPQKKGPPIQIKRAGTYDGSGFAGQLEMAGQTPKGPMSIRLDQKATHVPGAC